MTLCICCVQFPMTFLAFFLHATSVALLVQLSVINITSRSATALCTFSSGLAFSTLRCLVVCAPTPHSSTNRGQRSSISDSLQNSTTDTTALLTELAANTQYACDAVAVSSGIWSVEQHQVAALFRTLERECNVGNVCICFLIYYCKGLIFHSTKLS